MTPARPLGRHTAAKAWAMGFEYLIRYRPTDRRAWDAFVARLDNPTSDGGVRAFSLQLTSEGVHFVDHGRSAAAAVAFRRVVDEALVHANAVVVEEAE